MDVYNIGRKSFGTVSDGGIGQIIFFYFINSKLSIQDIATQRDVDMMWITAAMWQCHVERSKYARSKENDVIQTAFRMKRNTT